MEIKQLTDNAEKQKVTRLVLEALPDWFGIPEARENYIAESIDNIFFCAYDGDRPVGFLYLKETGEEYDRTNRFYLSLGFQEFEVFPTLWDEWNPCQIYIMSLK